MWTNLCQVYQKARITIDVFAKDLATPHLFTSVKWVALGGLELGVFIA